MKVAIGCIVVFFGASAIVAVLVGLGGFWLHDRAGELVEGVEARADAQMEASRILESLRDDHAFSPPGDGRLDPASVDRFLQATAIAWREIEPLAERIHEVAERNRAGEPRIGDLLEGARASGLLIDSRLHIANALDEVDMSLEEYVWTGEALERALRQSEGPSDPAAGRGAAATANIELVRRRGQELSALETDDGEPSPLMVLGLARAWTAAGSQMSDYTP